MSQQTGSNVTRLSQPGAGQTVNVPINAENMRLTLGFEPDPGAVEKNGQNLEFGFEDGGKLVLEGYYDHFASKTLPVMVTENGDELPGEDFLASLREDLLTAAGPGAGAGAGAAGSGAGEYADDAGSLVGGIGRMGSLGTDYWDRATEVSEIFPSVPPAAVAVAAAPTPGATPDPTYELIAGYGTGEWTGQVVTDHHWVETTTKQEWIESTFKQEWVEDTFKQEWVEDTFKKEWVEPTYKQEWTEPTLKQEWVESIYKQEWVEDTFKQEWAEPTYKQEWVDDTFKEVVDVPGHYVDVVDVLGHYIDVVDIPGHYVDVVDVPGHYVDVVDIPGHYVDVVDVPGHYERVLVAEAWTEEVLIPIEVTRGALSKGGNELYYSVTADGKVVTGSSAADGYAVLVSAKNANGETVTVNGNNNAMGVAGGGKIGTGNQLVLTPQTILDQETGVPVVYSSMMLITLTQNNGNLGGFATVVAHCYSKDGGDPVNILATGFTENGNVLLEAPEGYYIHDVTVTGVDKNTGIVSFSTEMTYSTEYIPHEAEYVNIWIKDTFKQEWIEPTYKQELVEDTFKQEWVEPTYKNEWVEDTFTQEWVDDTFTNVVDVPGHYVDVVDIPGHYVDVVDVPGHYVDVVDIPGHYVDVVDVPGHYVDVVDIPGHYVDVVDVPGHYAEVVDVPGHYVDVVDVPGHYVDVVDIPGHYDDKSTFTMESNGNVIGDAYHTEPGMTETLAVTSFTLLGVSYSVPAGGEHSETFMWGDYEATFTMHSDGTYAFTLAGNGNEPPSLNALNVGFSFSSTDGQTVDSNLHLRVDVTGVEDGGGIVFADPNVVIDHQEVGGYGIVFDPNGNEVVHGGVGNDILIGGEGNDTFLWLTEDMPTSGDATFVDTILNFSPGNDTIDLSALGLHTDEIHVFKEGDDIRLSFETAVGGEQQILITDLGSNVADSDAAQTLIELMIQQQQIKLVSE